MGSEIESDLNTTLLQQRHDSFLHQDYIAVATFRGSDLVIEQANSLICRIWGKKIEQVINKPLLVAVPELKGQGLEELLERVLATGEPYIGKERPIMFGRGTNFETLYFDFIYSPMRDTSTNGISGVSVMAIDVTRQVSIKNCLLDSEKRYRTLIEQSPLSIQIFSPGGITLHVNKAWEKLWGVKLEQLKGYNLLQDKQLEVLGIMSFIKKGFAGTQTYIPPTKYEPDKTIENVSTVPYRWVQAYIYPVKDEHGAIQEVVLIHQDITELKVSEEKSAKLSIERTELLALSQAKDEFIALASHQLRTPATAVKQYVGLVLDGYLGKLSLELNNVLTQAYASNERQIRIIDDLLKVAQVDSGTMHLKKNKIDVVPLIQDVIDGYNAVFEERRQVVEFKPQDKEIQTDIDVGAIRMVIENIIDNASKYTAEDKRIKVLVVRRDDKVEISVQDEGVGIANENLGKLFQKFSRIDNSKSLVVGGTGIGLYWAKRIVELHGGTITVTSKPDRGSTFTITIPLIADGTSSLPKTKKSSTK